MSLPTSDDFSIDRVTDLYLPTDNPRNGYFFPGKRPLPASMHSFAVSLAELAKKSRNSYNAITVDGRAWRYQLLPTATVDYHVFRRMPTEVPSLKDTGLPAVIANHLMSQRLLKGGLIIVAGLPGNGKSTTLASIIIDRLNKFGGICITVEDPIEMPLQGDHGPGLCLQRGVNSEEAFNMAIKDTLRAYPSNTPSMMMIGEVRDAESAALALRSSVDGRLVMITMHAGSVVLAIKRLVSMASGILTNTEARELLASSLRIALHQTLVVQPSGQLRPNISVLLDTQAVAGTIRQPTVGLDGLQNELNAQKTALVNGQKIELRPIN